MYLSLVGRNTPRLAHRHSGGRDDADQDDKAARGYTHQHRRPVGLLGLKRRDFEPGHRSLSVSLLQLVCEEKLNLWQKVKGVSSEGNNSPSK